jgi:hypothetical protein
MRVARITHIFIIQNSSFSMTLPTLFLALLISFLFGALYHFVRGGSGWRLLFYFGMSTLGFALGQLLSRWLGWMMFRFGSLEIGVGLIVSLLLLMLGEWLGRIEPKRESGV